MLYVVNNTSLSSQSGPQYMYFFLDTTLPDKTVVTVRHQ